MVGGNLESLEKVVEKLFGINVKLLEKGEDAVIEFEEKKEEEEEELVENGNE